MNGPDIRVTPERPSEVAASKSAAEAAALSASNNETAATFDLTVLARLQAENHVDNCPVCQHVPIAPRQLSPCGHHLCELCWITLFQRNPYDPQCPMCRTQVTTTEPDAGLEFKCRMHYSEGVYKRKFDANRELIVQAVLDPDEARPPADLIRSEHDRVEVAYQKQLTTYDKARTRIRRIQWLAYVSPFVQMLCALLLVALAHGTERWLVCLLLWLHTLEHCLPQELKDLRSIRYPERPRAIREAPPPLRALRAHASPVTASRALPIGEGSWDHNNYYMSMGGGGGDNASEDLE